LPEPGLVSVDCTLTGCAKIALFVIKMRSVMLRSNSSVDKPSVAFVAIDICSDDDNFRQYKLQSASKKIDQIRNRIVAMCKTLKEKELKHELKSNSMWIVAWREYGITEADSRVITPETKLLFKKVMQELTDQYPQLTIIAGTVATQKMIDKSIAQAKIDSIKDRYAEIDKISREEIRIKSSNEVKHHLDKVLTVEDSAIEQGFEVIRNTCFIFPGNYKRSKIAPFQEVNNSELPNSVFYPGRFENNIFSLPRPGSHDVFTVGIEICREHHFNTLATASAEQPFLHLVLSDSIDLSPENCRASYLIHIDSQDEIQYLNNDNPAAPKLAVYSLDLLNTFNLKAVHQRSKHPPSPKNQKSKLMDAVPSQNLFESVVISGSLTEEFIRNHLKDIDKPCGNNKLTALHYVIKEKEPNLALFLLEQGANPNIKDAKSQTPVGLALIKPLDLEVLEALVTAHADLKIENNLGRTPFDDLQRLISSGHFQSRELIGIRDKYLTQEAADKALLKTMKVKKRHNKALQPLGLFKAPGVAPVPVVENTRPRKRLKA
jgi:hypothetical protein